MKRIILQFILSIFAVSSLNAQTNFLNQNQSVTNSGVQNDKPSKLFSWINENVSFRKSFDGSKSEGKPATITYFNDFKNSNSYFNVDFAAKIGELSLLNNSESILIFYPKIEWHKNTLEDTEKDNLDVGINMEFLPFKLKSEPSTSGWFVSPWMQGTSSLKRNFITNKNESKLALQLSFASTYNWLPGSRTKFNNTELWLRYYPYFGIEYNEIPDLISENTTESFYNGIARMFFEIWFFPNDLQFTFDYTYRKVLTDNVELENVVPIIKLGLNIYPGNQDKFGFGLEYKRGNDPTAQYRDIEISSFSLLLKL